MTHINQKIPEGWSVKKLKACLSLLKDGTHGTHVDVSNGVMLLSAKDVVNGQIILSEDARKISFNDFNSLHKNYHIQNDDIVLTIVGTIGRCAIIKNYDNNYTFQRSVAILRPNKEITSKYLFSYIQGNSFQKELLKRQSVSAQPGVYLDDLSKISLIFPPLPEQEKIAGILGTWDEAIEKLSSLIEQKKLLKKGLMQRLLIGKTRLNGFTQPWKEVKLGDICKIATGKKDVNEGNPDGLYPFFTCAKINTFSDTFSFDQEAILIAGNGEVGHCQYYNGKFEAYQRTYILSDFTLSALLLFQYLNYFFKQRIDEQKQQGAMPYIKLKTLIDFQIYIPRDKNEQNSLLNILSTADDEINLLNKKLEALKEQKKGLMQQLLTGQTRVKVN